MAIQYPTALDNLTNPTEFDAFDTPGVTHAQQHADANDAIEALEAKVGADGSAVATSHDYRLTQLEAGTGPFVKKAGDTMMGALLMPDGAEATPSLRFASAATGFFLSSGVLKASIAATELLNLDSSGTLGLKNNSASLRLGASADVILSRKAAASLSLGLAAAAPIAQGLSAHDGVGTDIAGPSLTLAGGRSTGAGSGGSVLISTAPAGSSGSSLNNYVTRVTVDTTGRFLHEKTSGLTAAGTEIFSYLSHTINPAAGSRNFQPLRVEYTINASGAQTGAVSGILVTATETSLNGFSHLPINVLVGTIPKFQVFNSGDLSLFRREADNSSVTLTLSKRGASGDSSAAIANGATLSSLATSGWTGSATVTTAHIKVLAEEAWGASAAGSSMRFSTTPTGSTTAAERLKIDSKGNATFNKNLFYTPASLTYAATTDLDFDAEGVRTLSLTGNVTFTTSNRGSGKSLVVKVACDGTQRTLTFPAGWKFVGNAAPANIAANKTGILSLTGYGANDSDVVATWAVEP